MYLSTYAYIHDHSSLLLYFSYIIKSFSTQIHTRTYKNRISKIECVIAQFVNLLLNSCMCYYIPVLYSFKMLYFSVNYA